MPPKKRKSSGGDAGQGKVQRKIADAMQASSQNQGFDHVKIFETWLPRG